MLNDNNSPPRIIYTAKVPFKMSIITFSDKQKWRKLDYWQTLMKGTSKGTTLRQSPEERSEIQEEILRENNSKHVGKLNRH